MATREEIIFDPISELRSKSTLKIFRCGPNDLPYSVFWGLSCPLLWLNERREMKICGKKLECSGELEHLASLCPTLHFISVCPLL